MKPIYEQNFSITQNMTDRYGRAKPSALLYMIQQAAGEHCSLLAVDARSLSPKKLFWAVTRCRVQITRLPKEGEQVRVTTWPMPTTRVAFPRSVVAYDEEGHELFRSISLWVLMDENTRAMVLPERSGITVEGSLTGGELAVPHAIAARTMDASVTREVGYSLLDRNGHMNNTRYMDWVDDLLPSAFHENHPAREFTLCYLNEALEDDEISLAYQLSEEGLLTVDARKNVSGEQTRVFAAQVQF